MQYKQTKIVIYFQIITNIFGMLLGWERQTEAHYPELVSKFCIHR